GPLAPSTHPRRASGEPLPPFRSGEVLRRPAGRLDPSRGPAVGLRRGQATPDGRATTSSAYSPPTSSFPSRYGSAPRTSVVDVLVAPLADDQGLAVARGHRLDPLGSFGPPFGPEVGQAPSLRASRRSAARACASARSAVIVTNALIAGTGRSARASSSRVT